MRRFIYRFKPSSSIANMVGIKLHALGCRDYTVAIYLHRGHGFNSLSRDLL
ncbi:MAG: hypothetical protein QXP91_12435 [Candidatus Methanomethylicia archaeon]